MEIITWFEGIFNGLIYRFIGNIIQTERILYMRNRNVDSGLASRVAGGTSASRKKQEGVDSC